MKNHMKILLSAVLLICIYNCNISKEKYTIVEIDGVKYFKNTGEPSGKYRPSARFLFDIKGPENVPDSMKGFGSIMDIIADFNENIYILDGEHAVIKKYSRNGDFEMYFPDQKGKEVERFLAPNQFTLVYDSLLIYDSINRKYSKYLKNGNFVNSFWSIMSTSVKPIMLKSDGKTNISAFTFSTELSNGKEYSVNKLCLLNSRFKIEQVLKEIRIPTDSEFFFPDLLASYAIKDGLFYITENLSDAYRIYVTDDRGKTKYIIEKEFTKSPCNDYEKAWLNEFIKSFNYPPLDSTKVYYKKAINSIEIDKKDRIWTQPSLNRTETNQDSFYIDIFDKGIFINRTVLDFLNGNETYKLCDSRIYVISEDKKSIRVYDYE